MVFNPKSRPQGPTAVPNSYILVSSKPDNFDDMVKEVDALIKSEGRENDVKWTSQLSTIGIGIVNCDKAFADLLKKLPTVGSVEPEHTAHIADVIDDKTMPKKKPRKPGFTP